MKGTLGKLAGVVLPDGWAQHHRPVAEGTHPTQVRIMRASGGVPPYPLPDDWAPTGTLVWEGPGRVQQLNREASGDAAEQLVQVRDYQITLPVQVPAVQEGRDWAEALGTRFQIVQRQVGSLLWETVLVCKHNQSQS